MAPNGGATGGCATLTQDAVQGQTLSVGTGTWSPSPTSYTYQWKDCTTTVGQPPATGSCSNVAGGGTSSAYTVQASDVGKALVPVVTAYDGGTASTPTSVGGACSSGSTPGGALQNSQIYPDPTEPAGCSPISAVAGTAQTSEEFCTNSPVTCGFPDPLSGNVGVPPGTTLTPVSSVNCSGGNVITAVYITSGAINGSGPCTIQDSRVVDGTSAPPADTSNSALGFFNQANNVTIVHDDVAGPYSNSSASTTGTGEAQNIGAHCLYSYSGASSEAAALSGGPEGQISESYNYLHCAAESLNGDMGGSNDYIISDECSGNSGSPGCYNAGTTHNEAVYFPGGEAHALTNSVALNPWAQTAGVFTDCGAGGPANGSNVTGNLVGTYGNNGALGVQDGSNPACGTASNITVNNNRLAYIYNASMNCGWAHGTGVTFTGNIQDNNRATIPTC